jgi:hypothetical protein
MMAVGGLGLATSVVDGADALLRYAGPCILLGLVGWAAFWRPYVEVSDGGVTVANTLRTVRVPWPAVEGVEGRYGLRLRTAYGPVTAWAASAPAGRQRARGQDSEAAQAVTARLEVLRAAGHLEDARLERPAPVTTWHWEVIGPVALAALASLVLPLLA